MLRVAAADRRHFPANSSLRSAGSRENKHCPPFYLYAIRDGGVVLCTDRLLTNAHKSRSSRHAVHVSSAGLVEKSAQCFCYKSITFARRPNRANEKNRTVRRCRLCANRFPTIASDFVCFSLHRSCTIQTSSCRRTQQQYPTWR